MRNPGLRLAGSVVKEYPAISKSSSPPAFPVDHVLDVAIVSDMTLAYSFSPRRRVSPTGKSFNTLDSLSREKGKEEEETWISTN